VLNPSLTGLPAFVQARAAPAQELAAQRRAWLLLKSQRSRRAGRRFQAVKPFTLLFSVKRSSMMSGND